MAKNRLRYETAAGEISVADTYKQLLENLKLAEEDARTLSNLCKMKGKLPISKGWTFIANNFNKVEDIIINLATGKSISSVGYTDNA